jgi:hypothetical protein
MHVMNIIITILEARRIYSKLWYIYLTFSLSLVCTDVNICYVKSNTNCLDPEPILFIEPFLSVSCVNNLIGFNNNHYWYIALPFCFKVSGLTLNCSGDKRS